MNSQREDYLLLMIAQLREFLARVVRQREAGRPDEALVTAMLAQEKLFGRPLDESGHWSIEEQIEHLLKAEPAREGVEKCVLYAQLLAESARIYELRGPSPLAVTARQLTLWVLLAAHARCPGEAARIGEAIAVQAGALGTDGLPAELASALRGIAARGAD
jgi:hypothetical protein